MGFLLWLLLVLDRFLCLHYYLYSEGYTNDDDWFCVIYFVSSLVLIERLLLISSFQTLFIPNSIWDWLCTAFVWQFVCCVCGSDRVRSSGLCFELYDYWVCRVFCFCTPAPCVAWTYCNAKIGENRELLITRPINVAVGFAGLFINFTQWMFLFDGFDVVHIPWIGFDLKRSEDHQNAMHRNICMKHFTYSVWFSCMKLHRHFICVVSSTHCGTLVCWVAIWADCRLAKWEQSCGNERNTRASFAYTCRLW